ncbi:coiled-coil domain-containing protein 73-like [Centruroides vittatus]|uniref:coiled-coil domain-containing protein 73-like n=1 Tax=Centruroides vittatus TaxID=120091 RepID=UPI003510D234
MSNASSPTEHAESYEKCRTNLPFLQFEHISFESKLFEIVEELRLRRECDETNTAKIQQLIQENFEMKKQRETSEKDFEKMKEEFEKYKLDMKSVYECKISLIEEEKISNQVAVDCLKKEIETVKNEALKLQLEKLDQEKTIMELKMHLQARNNLQESTRDQLGEVQEMFDKLNRNCRKLSKVQQRLREDISQATSLCERVDKINIQYHEKLENLSSEYQKLKQEIVKVRSQLQEEYHKQFINRECIEIEQLHLKIKHKEEELTVIQKVLNQTKEDSDNKFKCLEESNRRLNKYVLLLDKANGEKNNLQEKLNETLLENQQLKEHMREIQGTLNENLKMWREKEKKKNRRLSRECQTNILRKIDKQNQTLTTEETEDDFNHVRQILFPKFDRKSSLSRFNFQNTTDFEPIIQNSEELKQNISNDRSIKVALQTQSDKETKSAKVAGIKNDCDNSRNEESLSNNLKLQNDYITSTSDNIPEVAECNKEDTKNAGYAVLSKLNFTEPITEPIKTCRIDEINDNFSENVEKIESNSTVTELIFHENVKENGAPIKEKETVSSNDKKNEYKDEKNNELQDNSEKNSEKIHLNLEDDKMLNTQQVNVNEKNTQLQKNKTYPLPSILCTSLNLDNMNKKNTTERTSLSPTFSPNVSISRDILGATSLCSVLSEKSELSSKRCFENPGFKEWIPPTKKFHTFINPDTLEK